MTQENIVYVPQALLDVFANYTLELPPLPKNALPALAQVGNELFATGARPAWVLRGTPVFLSIADLETPETEPETEDEDGVPEEALPLQDADDADEAPYFLCGFSGRGLQDRAFLYCYSSRHLRIAISVPFDHAYADPERERANLARVMELLVLVLQCTREGANLGTDGAGTLFWVKGWRDSSFQVRNGEGEVVLSGDTESALLDYLEQRRNALSEESVESRFWVKI